MVLAVMAGGLTLYTLTCAPGLLWPDSSTLQFRVWHTDLRGNLGLALAHPLYILLAKAFSLLPSGDFPFRVNLFSAVCAACCLGLTVDLALELTRSRRSAICAAVLLAVSHTFWRHAVIAEVYSLYTLALLAELSLLARFFRLRQARWLCLAVLVNGLNVSNHLLAVLHWPAYLAVVILAARRGFLRARIIPLLPAMCLVGAAPYLLLVFADLLRGASATQTLRSALFGNIWATDVLNWRLPSPSQLLRSLGFFVWNFPTPLILAAPAGMRAAWTTPQTRWFTIAGTTIFATSFLFAVRYPVADQYAFFSPCYVLLPLFVSAVLPQLQRFPLRRMIVAWTTGPRTARLAKPASAADPGSAIARKSPRRWTSILLLAALPALFYEAAVPLMRDRQIPRGVERPIPLRDTYIYYLLPRKNGEDSAERFARAALTQAEPDGLLIADPTIMDVLVYVRDIEGIGRGVTLTRTSASRPLPPSIPLKPNDIRPFVQRNAAFACTDVPGYVPGWVLERHELHAVGVLYRLSARPAPAAPYLPENE